VTALPYGGRPVYRCGKSGLFHRMALTPQMLGRSELIFSRFRCKLRPSHRREYTVVKDQATFAAMPFFASISPGLSSARPRACHLKVLFERMEM